FQSPFLVVVSQRDHQQERKNQHGEQPESARNLERNRPGEEKRDLEIENDENDGDQVVADVEAHARIFEGLESAFIGRELFRIRSARAQKPTYGEQRQAQNRG